MNRNDLRSWLREHKRHILFAILLVVMIVIVLLTARYQKRVDLPVELEAIPTPPVTLPDEQTFLEREADVPEVEIPEALREVLGPPPGIDQLGGVFGGKTRVILIRVVAPGQTPIQIQPAVDAGVEGIGLLNQFGSSHFPGIDPSLTAAIEEHTVNIGVDPHDVPETVWVAAVAAQLHPGCSFPSKWTCILEWMTWQKQPSDQSVIGALLPLHQPIFPGQTYHIGAYCRRFLCVISAEDGYITAGYGGWLAAHEFGHAFGAKHPTDQTGAPMGYWCRPNIFRDDVMHRITSQTISRRTLEIMGLFDIEPNNRADINQSTTTIAAQIVGQTLIGNASETPAYPGSCWTLGPFSPHRVMGVQVKVGNGQFQPAQPADGAWGGYEEAFTFSLAGVQQPVLLTVRANMNGKVVERTIWYGTPPPSLGRNIYLPIIAK